MNLPCFRVGSSNEEHVEGSRGRETEEGESDEESDESQAESDSDDDNVFILSDREEFDEDV